MPTPTPPEFLRLAAHPLRWRLLTALAESDLRVRELVAIVGEPQNLVSYHLRLLREGGLVRAGRSSFDGRDSYYHLDLERCAAGLAGTGTALHPALDAARSDPSGRGPGPPRHRPSVLFACTGNSARSPIAEALLRHRAGAGVAVVSAGSRPKPALHPGAVHVLRTLGIDLTGQRPRHLASVARRRFDVVVTLCDKVREVCPELPGDPRRIHWSIVDPATADDADDAGHPAFRRTAADIDTRVRHLVPVLQSIHRGGPP